jgi:hypothetical protein
MSLPRSKTPRGAASPAPSRRARESPGPEQRQVGLRLPRHGSVCITTIIIIHLQWWASYFIK